MDPGGASLLWAVRNSLVHAFTLPDSGRLAQTGHQRVGLGQRETTPDLGGLVTIAHHGDEALVYVDGLFRVVKHGIYKYQETLYGTDASEARVVFMSAFSSYGWIRVASEA